MKEIAIANAPSQKKRHHFMRWLCAVLALGLLIWWWRYSPPPVVGGGQPDNFIATRLKNRTYASIPPLEEKGFERLNAANANGWYSLHQEPIQTFELYQSQHPMRPTPQRRTIVLQPLGPMSKDEKQLLLQLKEFCAAFFQLPVRIAKPLSLSSVTSWRKATMPRRIVSSGQAAIAGRQYDAGVLAARFLAPRLPKDAAAYLGITMTDLWAGDMSYVFGLGTFEKRTGVYSLCRYFPEFWGHQSKPSDRLLTLRRACQVLNHETGHMLGLQHCVLYTCSMNGCNSLVDADAAPLDYCPVCHRKLLWNIGCDGLERYSTLLKFYRKHRLDAEAQWTAARLKRWQQIESKEPGDKKDRGGQVYGPLSGAAAEGEVFRHFLSQILN